MEKVKENGNDEVTVPISPINGSNHHPATEFTATGSSSQPQPLSEDPHTHPPALSSTTPTGRERITKIEWLLIILAIILVVFPFLFYALAAYVICGKDVTELKVEKPKHGTKKVVYQKVQEYHDAAIAAARLVSIIHLRVVVILLVWLVINLSVPFLRRKIVLGSNLWKWSLLLFLVTCSYYATRIITHLILFFLVNVYKRGKNWEYYLRGLRRSVNWMIVSCTLCVTWHFYFSSDDGLTKTSDTKVVFHVGTTTFLSFLLLSFLWLIKNALLLQWEESAVYCRFRAKILRAGFQLYFLALIIGGTYWDIFRPGENEPDENEQHESMEEEGSSGKRATAESDGGEDERRKKERERGKVIGILALSSKHKTTYLIKSMAQYFVSLAEESSRDGRHISKDIELLQEKCSQIKRADNQIITAQDLSQFELDEHEIRLLFVELGGGQSQVAYATFERWMTMAHKKCLALGFTLRDAKQAVKCLDRFMTGFSIALFILSWLLLNRIATLNVLIGISPFLAATLIFGETCKNLFDGITFAFVRHPFDVGDRCVIDGIELEVKRMDILSTTFLKMDRNDETVYPNSVLATKAIDNLKGDPDPRDYLELSLDCSTEMSKIDELINKIKQFIANQGDDRKYENSSHIVVKEIGNNIKISIRFKHLMSILDVTHFQCSEKKRRQRSELLQCIKKYTEELGIKIAAA